MSHVVIPVLTVEFDDLGHTIWVHGTEGTVLRIKTRGILVNACENGRGVGLCSHADMVVDGTVTICLGSDVEKPL